MEEEHRYDHEHGYILRRNGIMECYTHPTNEVDLRQAEASSRERIEFSGSVSYPCLFDITTAKEFSREARDYLANEGNDLVLASAILIDSAVTKMVGNFFIAVNKPKNPTRLFIDKANALEWLEQFKPSA